MGKLAVHLSHAYSYNINLIPANFKHQPCKKWAAWKCFIIYIGKRNKEASRLPVIFILGKKQFLEMTYCNMVKIIVS